MHHLKHPLAHPSDSTLNADRRLLDVDIEPQPDQLLRKSSDQNSTGPILVQPEPERPERLDCPLPTYNPIRPSVFRPASHKRHFQAEIPGHTNFANFALRPREARPRAFNSASNPSVCHQEDYLQRPHTPLRGSTSASSEGFQQLPRLVEPSTLGPKLPENYSASLNQGFVPSGFAPTTHQFAHHQVVPQTSQVPLYSTPAQGSSRLKSTHAYRPYPIRPTPIRLAPCPHHPDGSCQVLSELINTEPAFSGHSEAAKSESSPLIPFFSEQGQSSSINQTHSLQKYSFSHQRGQIRYESPNSKEYEMTWSVSTCTQALFSSVGSHTIKTSSVGAISQTSNHTDLLRLMPSSLLCSSVANLPSSNCTETDHNGSKTTRCFPVENQAHQPSPTSSYQIQQSSNMFSTFRPTINMPPFQNSSAARSQVINHRASSSQIDMSLGATTFHSTRSNPVCTPPSDQHV